MKNCLIGLSVAVATVSVYARTCTWTGAENGFWTNANNWSEGVVPGIIVAPDGTYPSGEETVDEAVFGPVADGAATTINLNGHRCVSNFLITAGAPAYTFGTGASQQLGVVMPNGHLTMAAGVTADQTFACKTYMGYWDTAIGSQRGSTLYSFVRNDGTGLLHLQGGLTGNYNHYLTFQGSGDVKVSGNYAGSLMTQSYLDGTFICAYAATGWESDAAFKSFGCKSGGGSATSLRRFSVPTAESRLVLYDWGSPYVPAFDENTTVTGEGIFDIYNSHPNEASPYNEGRYGAGVSVASGKTLTVGTRMMIKSKRLPTIYAIFNSAGTFNPQGAMLGAYYQFRIGAGTLQVAKIGNVGCAPEETRVGTNVTTILFQDAGTVLYDGAGETTDRNWGFMAAKTGTVRNGGSGTLTLAGAVTSAVNSATLKLDASTSPIVFAGTVEKALHPVKLAVAGTAGVTLGAAGADFAALSLEGGVLAVTGDITLPAVIVTSGANTLNVAADQTVTLASLTAGSGTLNIVTADSTAKVKVSGQTSGALPASITINGKSAQFASDGTVEKRTVLIDTEISAYGGRIPNDAAKNVGITSVGNAEDGPVKLAAAGAAAVGALAQKTTVDATVDLAAGDTLTAGTLFAGENAKNLAIGSAVGQGTFAAAAGALTLWPEGVANLIDIAATPDLSAATSIEKLGEGTARFTGPFAYAKTVALQEGTLAANIASDTAQNFTLAGAGTFVKEGSGKLTVGTGKNTQFEGDFVVAGGKVTPGATSAGALFGVESAGALVITNGGALHTHDAVSSSVNFGNKFIRLSGQGTDGKGALVFNPSATKNVDLAISNLALDGDTTISATPIGYDIMKVTKFFDMGGHALTRSGSDRLFIGNGATSSSTPPCVVTNPGPIYLEGPAANGGSEDNNNFLVFFYASAFPNGGPTIYVTNENVRVIVQNSSPVPCPIVVSNVTLKTGVFGDNNSLEKSIFTGPVTIAGENGEIVDFGYSGGGRLHGFTGNISGKGKFTQSTGNLYLSGSNSYEGVTTYNGSLGSGSYSRMTLMRPESLPAVSNFVCASAAGGGSVNVWLKRDRTIGWTDAKIINLMNAIAFPADTYLVGLDMTETGDYELRTSTLPAVVNDGKYHGLGAGMLRSQDATNTLKVVVDSNWGNSTLTLGTRNGRVKVTDGGNGSELSIRRLFVTGDCSASTSVVEICGNATVKMSTAGSTVACNDNNTSFLRIHDATLKSDSATSDARITLASCTTAYGILEVGAGALLENICFTLCAGDGSRGAAIYQDGGKIVSVSGYTYLGSASGGFWALNAGEVEIRNNACLQGSTQTNAHALVYQTGGTFRHHSSNAMYGGRGKSYTHYYLTGGNVDIAGTGTGDGLRYPDYSTSNAAYTDGQAVVTVAGADAIFAVTNTKRVVLANQKNGFGAINLNAGTFAAGLVAANPNGFANARAFLNFDGGTLKVNKDTTAFATGDITFLLGPNGGTVDTDGHTVTLGKPFVRAATGVVSAIPFGPVGDVMMPYSVRIAGDGAGATAVVNYDRASRTMTGITVTSGGTGYTWAKAYVYSGAARGAFTNNNYGKLYTIDCTISAPSAICGTFRKVGAGTLVMGTDALPEGTPLDVAEGTLDLNGLDPAKLGSVTASGCGTVMNSAGTLVMPSTYTVDVPNAVAGAYLTVSGASITLPTTIALKDADKVSARTKAFPILKVSGSAAPTGVPAIAGELPVAWELFWVGNTLKLGVPRGMVIYFK